MRAKQLLTIAVVSTLLIGGLAALGAASPADQANDNASDAYDENAPDDVSASDHADADNADNASDRADNAESVGPSDGLPEQAPDHVSEIHDRIDSFLSGSVDNLGESLSELLGDGEVAEDVDNADENADNADENDGDAAEA